MGFVGLRIINDNCCISCILFITVCCPILHPGQIPSHSTTLTCYCSDITWSFGSKSLDWSCFILGYPLPPSQQTKIFLTDRVCPIGCGGWNPPPSRIYVVPRKMLKEKVANFLWLHKYGVLETTFCNQVTFGPAGRGQMWSKLAKFHKGGLCQEQNEGKIHDTNKCQLQNVSHHFWVGLGLAPD